jgi:hypothetical protein
MTSSICSVIDSKSRKQARMAKEASCGAEKAESAPPKAPMGVRLAASTTVFVMD